MHCFENSFGKILNAQCTLYDMDSELCSVKEASAMTTPLFLNIVTYTAGATALHCTELHCTSLNSTALHCTALHCTALYYIALHFIILSYV